MIAAGDLRERVTIESRSGQDADGQPLDAWTTVDTVWAAVTAANARESQAGGREQAVRTWTVLLRYRSDVTPDMRLTWRGRNLNIVQVLPDRPNGVLHLVCEEVQ